MKFVLTVIVALVGITVIGVAGGSGTQTGTTASRPGLAVVYAEIAAETDCAALQSHFDSGSRTQKRSGYVPNGPAFAGAQGARWSEVGLGYMEAADDRMQAIGCY